MYTSKTMRMGQQAKIRPAKINSRFAPNPSSWSGYEIEAPCVLVFDVNLLDEHALAHPKRKSNHRIESIAKWRQRDLETQKRKQPFVAGKEGRNACKFCGDTIGSTRGIYSGEYPNSGSIKLTQMLESLTSKDEQVKEHKHITRRNGNDIPISAHRTNCGDKIRMEENRYRLWRYQVPSTVRSRSTL